MTAHKLRAILRGVGCLICLGAVAASTAHAQTVIPGGFEINLLPGFKHEPLQGIDSIVGKIAGKELTIMYEIGPVPKEGAPLFGGSYINQAIRLPEGGRQWLRHQVVGTQAFDIAYGKDGRLIISTTGRRARDEYARHPQRRRATWPTCC